MNKLPLLLHRNTDQSSYQEISLSRTSFSSLLKNIHPTTMINSKKLIRLAKKWQKMAAMKRRRISFPRSAAAHNSSVANKGHFVVYTTDNMRFTVPLEYLRRNVFVELFRMSEEEFGLRSDGPITLPCDSVFLNYVMSLVQGCMPEEIECALLTSLSMCHFSASPSGSLEQNQQQLICSY